jgi:uncharacterized membrane protein
MINRNGDLVTICVLALVAVLAVLVDQPLLRFVLGAPLALWLPGYALTSAIFNRGEEIGGTMRLLLTLSLSIAVTVLVGFVLNLTPWGLRPIPWALWLGMATIFAAVVAVHRRRGQTLPRRRGIGFDLSLPQTFLLGAALLVIGIAFGVARWGAMQAPSTPGAEAAFTQLWVTPVTQADGEAVQIAIHNRELTAETYRLEVTAGEEIIYGWAALMVGRDQRWQQIVPLPDNDAPVEAHIWRVDAPDQPYRSVVLRRESD